MYEVNPFTKTTLSVWESKPPKSSRRTNVQAIAIRPVDRYPQPKPDLAGIDALLGSLPQPKKIKLIEIDYDSKMTALPSLDRFANLEYAHIGAGKIKSYEALGLLKKLRSLFIVNYGEPDLGAFKHLKLDSLRLIRGRFSSVTTTAKLAFFQSCSKLHEFSGGRIEHLLLDGCHNVDLDSLHSVKGLTRLEVLGRKSFPHFKFLTRCKGLRELVVTASPLGKSDLKALEHATSLRRVFLSISDKLVARIGKANKRLLVTNADLTYYKGAPSDDHWEDHWNS